MRLSSATFKGGKYSVILVGWNHWALKHICRSVHLSAPRAGNTYFLPDPSSQHQFSVAISIGFTAGVKARADFSVRIVNCRSSLRFVRAVLDHASHAQALFSRETKLEKLYKGTHSTAQNAL